MGIVRTTIALVPIVGLGWLGFKYAESFGDFLLAPDVPVTVPIATPGGKLRVSIDRYRIDLNAAEATVRGLTVRDDRGQVLGTLKGADVRVAGIQDIWRARAFVELTGVRANVRRLSDGKFELERFVSKEKGEPGKNPFEVAVRDARVRLIDDRSKTEFTMVVPRGRFSGLGDDWKFMGDLQVPGNLTAGVTMSQIPNKGIAAKFEGIGWRTNAALVKLLRTELPNSLSLQSAEGRGTLTALFPSGRPARFAYVGTVSASEAKYESYKFSRSKFTGTITEGWANGEVSIDRLGLSMTGQALVDFRSKPRFVARAKASLRDLAAISDLKIALPRGTAGVGIKLQGSVSGSIDRYAFAGEAKVDQVRYQKYSAKNTSVTLAGNERELFVDIPKLDTNLGSARGQARVGLRDQTVAAYVTTDQIKLNGLADFGVPKELSCQVSGSATIVGKLAKPSVVARLRGNGQYRISPDRAPIPWNDLRASASVSGDVVSFNRLTVKSGTSTLVGVGSLNLKGAMSLRVAALDLRLEEFLPAETGVTGRGVALIDLAGPLKRPTFKGSAEGYFVQANDILVPVVRTDVSGDLDKIRLENLRALQGPSEISGTVQANLLTRKLFGRLGVKRLQLAEYLGEDAMGAVSAEQVLLGGTLESPSASALLVGENLGLVDAEVDSLRVPVELNGSLVKVIDAEIRAYGGTAALNADYDLKRRTGSLDGSFEKVRLKDVTSASADVLDGTGTIAGTLKAEINPAGQMSARLQSEVEELVLNGTAIGSGDLSLVYDGNTVNGEANIGQLDRFIQANVQGFDLETRQFAAELFVNRFLLADFVEGGSRYLQQVPYDARRRLEELNGVASFAVRAYGSLDDPNLELDSLTAEQVEVSKIKIGDINLKGSWKYRVATVDSATVAGPLANVSISGQAVENGTLVADGEISNLRISDLAELAPQLTSVAGTVSVPFSLSGTVRDPILQASLETEGLLENKDLPNSGLDLSLDQISLTNGDGKEGGAQVAGVFRYRGFAGRIEANVPFRFDTLVTEEAPLSGRIELKRRPLADIAEFSKVLRADQTQGEVFGNIEISGTAKAPLVSGGVFLQAQNIALAHSPNGLRDASISVQLQENSVRSSAKFGVTQGGEVDAELGAELGDIAAFVQTTAEQGIDALLSRPVAGKVAIRNVRHSQGLTGGSVDVNVSGSLNLSGSVRSPLIAGNLSVRNGSIVVPQIETAPANVAPPLVDPRFDVKVNVADFTRVQAAGTADMYLYGDSEISGSLTRPKITSEIFVERGTFQLPGGKIRLEQGGTVDLEFDGDARTSVAAMRVNLIGTTAVTTALLTQIPERYDVRVNVTGDLLKEGGLFFSAESDPPGLNQDQIIGLLGRTDVLQGFGNSGERDLAEERLRSAIVGLAVPLVFERLTSPLAQGLGLDFLSLEYNQFDKGTLLLAKNIGRDFILQARRQLGQPLPGFPVRYEFRLDYRPRKLKGWLSRVSFFVGQDEIRPIKVGFNYTVRF